MGLLLHWKNLPSCFLEAIPFIEKATSITLRACGISCSFIAIPSGEENVELPTIAVLICSLSAAARP